jgi:Uma2 family endonuclease
MSTPAIQLHRWSRLEYDRMIACGVFHPEARLELVDGEIFHMTPQGSLHATAIQLVTDVLRTVFQDHYAIRIAPGSGRTL